MAVLITCGFEPSWCTFAQQRLTEMGVRKPLKAERYDLSEEELLRRMCAAHSIAKAEDGAQSEHHNQTASFRALCEGAQESNPSMGRAWEFAAADLFLTNAEASVWGWADARNALFLNFWKEFDPGCKFVLIYGPPSLATAGELKRNNYGPVEFDEILESWYHYHEEILAFYQANADRSILVSFDAFEERAADVAKLVKDHFGADLLSLNEPKYRDTSAILELLAEYKSAAVGDSDLLLSEFNNIADLPFDEAAFKVKAVDKAFSELRQHMLDATALDEMELKLAQKNDQLQAAHGLTEDNKLLKLQLNQAQSELESYFLKYQEAVRQKPSVPKPVKQVQIKQAEPLVSQTERAKQKHIVMDMRVPIDGVGWHPAEAHGRWAGAGLDAQVNLENLEPVQHTLSITITDAMELSILRGLRVSLNGQALNVSRKILANMGGRLAPLRRMKANISKVEKPYPVVLSARISPNQIAAAGRPNHLVLSAPYAVSPSAGGDLDARTLTVCVSRIEIEQTS